MDDIHTLFKGQVKVANDKAIDFGGENYLAALFEEAEGIMADDNEIDIVNKLVLSMAIRLKAEEYMGKVLMLTSENIHFNNFMFEPLVDISILHLKQLYGEIKGLIER